MLFFLLKTLHVLAAVLFLGAGLGSAYYKARAYRSRDARVIAWCDREIVRADWLLTIPAGVALPLSGLWMVHLWHLPWDTSWVLLGIGGYAIAGVTWLPAAYLQIKMRRLSAAADAAGTEVAAEYHPAQRAWFALGIPSFVAALLTVWVMVAKRLL